MFRNPAVAIEDWPEPGDESDFEDVWIYRDEDKDETDGDQDPEFVEREAPLGLNAEDQHEIGDDELEAFLEEHLVDMDKYDWLNICKLFLFYSMFNHFPSFGFPYFIKKRS